MNYLKKLLGVWSDKVAQPQLSFLNLKFTSTIVISGKKDSGKSYFANKLLEKCTRYVLWDSRYERVSKITPFTSKKAKLVTDKEIKITSSISDIGRYNKIVFHPYAKTKKEMMELFDILCQRVYRIGSYILAVEEADSIADRFHPLESGLFELVQGNIHVNCGLLFITRRLQNLNPDIVRLADELFIFKYSTKDKQYLESYIGVDTIKDEIPERSFYRYDGKEAIYYGGIE